MAKMIFLPQYMQKSFVYHGIYSEFVQEPGTKRHLMSLYYRSSWEKKKPI